MATGTSTSSPGSVTPERTERERAAERHGERAVGAPPVADHHQLVGFESAEQRARRRRPSARTASRRRPAAAPAAVCTAARIAPPPGIGPSGVGYVTSSLVPIRRAPSRAAVDGDAHALVVELAVEADHDDVDRHARRIVAGDGYRAPRDEGLGDARPAAHEHPLAGIDQRGRGHRRRERRRRRPGCRWRPAPPPGRRGGRPSCWSRTRTRRPDARSRATPSTEPGIGWWASQITPSRSQSTARGSTTGAPYRRPGPSAARQNGAVPRFEPFRAVRYAPAVDLDAVIAPPYDVLSDADVDALEARDPRNIVHVDVPRGGADRYEIARSTCCGSGWPRGVLVADETPTFTLYRMRFPDAAGVARDLVGVLGGLEVVDEGAGGVLPHERTTPKASTDRLDLTRATDGQPVAGVGPVAGLRADRAARRARRTGRGRDRRRRRARRRAGHRPGPHRRHPRAPRPRRRADRRRPPPLRGQPGLPGRGASSDGPTRHGGRADAGLRRRAGRRAAQHRGHPPAVHRRHVRRAARRAGARRSS